MDYTIENPRIPALAEATATLRSGIQETLLDEGRSFDDRIHAVRASLEDDWRPYHADPVLKTLEKATGNLILTKVLIGNKTGTGLVLGVLDTEKPWEFIDTTAEDGEPNVGLQANFVAAQYISDTHEYWHESCHYGSMRKDTFPTVSGAKTQQQVVLPTELPSHNELLYRRLQRFTSTSLHIGEWAIHKTIAELQKDKNPEEIAALHAAASIAVRKMGIPETNDDES